MSSYYTVFLLLLATFAYGEVQYPTVINLKLYTTSNEIRAVWDTTELIGDVKEFQLIRTNFDIDQEYGYFSPLDTRYFTWDHDVLPGNHYEICVYLLFIYSSNREGMCANITTLVENPTVTSIQLVTTSKKIIAYWETTELAEDVSQFQLIRTNFDIDQEYGYFSPLDKRSFTWNYDVLPGSNYQICIYILFRHSAGREGMCANTTTALHDPTIENLALNMDNLSVRASWDVLYGGKENVAFYQVSWTPPHNGGTGYSTDYSVTTYLIEDLRPEVDYEVCVQVETPSAVLLEPTCENIIPVADFKIVDIEFSPTNSDIQVTWGIEGTGNIVNPTFHVTWRTDYGDDSGNSMTSIPGYTVKNIIPSTNYTVCIQGHDGNDIVTLNHCKRTVTLPTEVEVTSLKLIPGYSAVIVEWDIIHHDPSVNYDAFLVTWLPAHNDGSSYTSSDETVAEIHDLTPSTQYTVCVQAQTELGVLLHNTCGDTTTLDEKAIDVFQVLSSSHVAAVYWTMNDKVEGVFQNFRVTWGYNGVEDLGEVFTTNEKSTSQVISNLDSATYYVICVSAHALSGAFTEKYCGHTTTERYDPEIDEITLSSSSSSIEVHWTMTSTSPIEQVTNFLITWDPPHNGGSDFTSDSVARSAVISDLTAQTTYEVCVQPMTTTGILMTKACQSTETQ